MNVIDKDKLMNDILDGEHIDRPWHEWTTRADSDPTLWQELAEAHRDQLALMRTVHQASAVAESAGTPSAVSDGVSESALDTFGNIGASRRAWMGWAVAAAVILVAGVSQYFSPKFQAMPESQGAAQFAGWSPEQYLQQYLQHGEEQGTVIGELPQRVLIDARPSATGIGYDVIFLRQIQERQTVPDLYEVAGQDDTGQVQLVGYEPPRGGAM